MKNYTVDFGGAKTVWDIHQALKDGLELPDYYGMNFDALWDCLTGYIIYPSVITLKNLNGIPQTLGEDISMMMKVFSQLRQINSEIRIIY